jgi:hypothetical protein
VLKPDTDFFRYFSSPSGQTPPGAAASSPPPTPPTPPAPGSQ